MIKELENLSSEGKEIVYRSKMFLDGIITGPRALLITLAEYSDYSPRSLKTVDMYSSKGRKFNVGFVVKEESFSEMYVKNFNYLRLS